MTEIHSIAAEPRQRLGTGGARAVRRQGRVPGVIYGRQQTPVMISLDYGDLDKERRSPGFFGTLYDVTVDGETYRCLPRELQVDPVKSKPVHIDFLRVTADTKVNIWVPVVFTDEEESPGLKRGGVLNVVRHEVELICGVTNIPQNIVCSLAGLDINDSAHISRVRLPEGVTPAIQDRDFTVATVAAPTVMPVEEEVAPEEEEEAEAVEGAEEGEAEAEGEAEEKEKEKPEKEKSE